MGLLAPETGGSWLAKRSPPGRPGTTYGQVANVLCDRDEPFEDEARFRRATDGEYRWFLVRAEPLRRRNRTYLSNGTEFFTASEDRKRTQQALKRSEAYLAERRGRLTSVLGHSTPASKKPPIGRKKTFSFGPSTRNRARQSATWWCNGSIRRIAPGCPKGSRRR